MVSKSQIKLITSLIQKKYRKQHRLFIAEGVKVIEEFLNSNLQLEHIYMTQEMFLDVSEAQKSIISENDLKISVKAFFVGT